MSEAVNITTPVGKLEWIFITGKGKKDLNGKDRFVAGVVLETDSQLCQDFIGEIDEFWTDNKPKKAKDPKSLGYRNVLDAAKEPTGFTSFNFWTGIMFPDGSSKVVKVFNAKGAEISLGSKKIGNESRGRIKGAMAIYDNGPGAVGVTLYLNGIQLTKFVEFTGGVSFDEVDDEDGEGFEGVDDDGMDALTEEEATGDSNPEAQPRL